MNAKAKRSFIHAALAALAAAIVLGFAAAPPAHGVQPSFKAGVVASRNLVRGPNGQPIFAEFDSRGEVVQIIGEAFGELEGAYVLAGDVYRALTKGFIDFRQAHAQGIARGARILSRDEYEDEDFGNARIPNVTPGEPPTEVPITKPPLPQAVRSVFVRATDNFVTVEQALEGPILLKSSIDLREASSAPLADDVRAVLLNSAGQILHRAETNIGYRVAFFEGEDIDIATDSSEDGRSTRKQGDKLLGPVDGVRVYTTLAERFASASDLEGRYSVRYFLPPCPGFTFDYSHSVIAELRFQNFNPRAPVPRGTFYASVPAYDFCNGLADGPFPPTLLGQMTRIAVIGIIASQAIPVVRSDVKVDVIMLTGEGRLSNSTVGGGSVGIGDDTTYQYAAPTFTPAAPTGLDLDLDRRPDRLGAPAGGRVGVFLDELVDPAASGDEAPEPDLYRFLDESPDYRDQGLLATVSADDLQETDLYVFRASNGQLVTERIGLRDDEYVPYTARGAVEGENRFFYRLVFRGPRLSRFLTPRRIEQFQQLTQLNEELHGREADHLRVGEQVDVIAINRKTGYIGRQRTTIAAVGDSGTARIDFPIGELILAPPNLKVRVDRVYTVEKGLTRGEDRERQVTSEGSALTDDTYVAVSTEWTGHDGTPLPAELPGYTGRLAIVTAPNQLGDSGDVAPFEIEPGRHVKLLRLRGSSLRSEHFYVHVHGEPLDRTPSFAAPGAGQGPLQYRPKHYVPFRVAFLDEPATRARKQALAYARQDGLTEAETVPAVYRWHYRPEMAFSVLDLDVRKIEREDLDGDVQNILVEDDDRVPAIGIADAKVTVSYDLLTRVFTAGEFGGLPPFGPEGQYVFALGEDEVRAFVGENGEAVFENIEHLSQLNPEDFLSIRLYQHADPENVLWEFAFAGVTVFPETASAQVDPDDPDSRDVRLTADRVAEGPLIVSALLDRASAEELDSQVVYWRETGDGNVNPSSVSSSNGVFGTELTLPPRTDATSVLTAVLDAAPGEFDSPRFVVIPGEAASIVVEASGEAAIGGMGEIALEVEVRDAHGNLVVDGTTLDVTAPDLTIEGPLALTDGKTTLRVRGGDLSGNVPLVLSVGTAEHTETVDIADIELSFSNLGNVPTNSSRAILIQASSDLADLSGLTVELAAHRGGFASSTVTIDGSNSATAVFESGRFRGFAQISALVANTTRVATAELVVVEDTEDHLESNVLVPDGSGTLAFGNGARINYGPTTNLVVYADPGETVEPSLADIFVPPVYALLDYDADAGQYINPTGGDTTLRDISGGIDASANGITLARAGPAGFNLSWRFVAETRIDIPAHPAVSGLTEAGVNFWLRLPDVPAAGAPLVDWDDLGLELDIDAGGTLTLSALTDVGTESVTSTGTLVPGRWHQIAAHYYNGRLRLGLDGTTHLLDTAGTLAPADLQGYAMRIGADATAGMTLTGLRIYDWQGEAKVQFANGEFEMSAVTDGAGEARMPMTARPPVLAYSRPYAPGPGPVERAFARFIPAAHAQGQPVDECVASLDPISPDAPDPLIAEAERFFQMVLQCFLLPKVEEARVNYQTSRGFFRKSAALIKREVYEGIYALVERQANNVIIFANCLDAAVSGSNASAVGAGCDFITSMLAIGDIRDLLIQAYHYHIGDRDNYDALTANLAGLGLVLDGAQLIPAIGTTAGIAINALTAAGKQVAKFLKLVGPAGIRAARIIGVKIDELTDIILDGSIAAQDKVKAIERYLPFIQIAASLALVFQSEPDLFRFLVAMVRSEDTFDNLVGWLERYMARLAAELDPSASVAPLWLDFFVPSAHAVGLSQAARNRFRKELNAALELLRKSGANDVDDAAKTFNTAVKIFLKRADAIDNVIRDVDDMKVLRAFCLAKSVDEGTDAVEALTRLNGFDGLGIGRRFTVEKFVEALGLIDLKKLNASDALKLEIKRAFLTVGSTEFGKAKGDVFKLLKLVEDSLDPPPVRRIGDMEVRVDVDVGGEAFGAHVMDLEYAEIVDGILYAELKSWAATTLRSRLKQRLQITTRADRADETGQLLIDLADFQANGGNFRMRWIFSPEIASDSITSGSDIGDVMLDLMKNDDKVRDEVIKAMGFVGNVEGYDELLNSGAFVRKVRAMFEIDDLTRTREALGLP